MAMLSPKFMTLVECKYRRNICLMGKSCNHPCYVLASSPSKFLFSDSFESEFSYNCSVSICRLVSTIKIRQTTAWVDTEVVKWRPVFCRTLYDRKFMYAHYIEGRSRNHWWSGKAVTVTYSECEGQKPHVFSMWSSCAVLYGRVLCFSTLSHKCSNFREKKIFEP